MKLSTVLSQITGNATAKTAAVAPSLAAVATAPSGEIGERLKQALKEATAPEATKVASQSSPVEDLTKIAADLSRSEHEALVKEAQLYGASVCDGFMARAAQYNAAAAAQPASTSKTASDESFDKFASENPDLVKEAAQLGYDTTVSQLEKLSASAYDAGWNQVVHQVHKTACDSFVAGFKAVVDIIEDAR